MFDLTCLAEEVDYFQDLPEFFGAIKVARHSHWQTVRMKFVTLNPFCSICNSNKELQVHHRIPFHLDRSLELDPANLIVLCQPHHLYYGHLGDWKSYNPVLDNTIQLVKTRPYSILER